MLIKDIWNFDKNKNPSLFYNKYEPLNTFFNVAEAEPQTLKKLQTDGLKAMYKAKGQGYEKVNKFLKEILGDKQGTEEDLFAILVNAINEGLDEFRSDSNKINKNWIKEKNNYYNKLDDIISEINKAVNKASGSEGIPAPTLDSIKNAIGNSKASDFTAAKGKYLEDLAAWILIKAGLAGFATGAWQAQDTFFNEESAYSIIEDSMGFILDNKNFNNNFNNSFLGVKIIGYSKMNQKNKQEANQKLQNWINSVKELNGLTVANGEVQIGSNISNINEFVKLTKLFENSNTKAGLSLSLNLSSDLYQEIQKMSINIQSKSNIERHLANGGKRSLYYIPKEDDIYNTWVNFSKTELVLNNTAVSVEEFNTDYEEFSAYVNYNLSKNINKTVYARNEFYLTKEGFTDLATLMEKRGFFIRIKDIKMSYAKFLSNGFGTLYSNYKT